MDKQVELIQRAIDANGFLASDTEAGYINPEYWDRQVLDHIRVKTVMLPLGQDITARMPSDGDTFNITILAEPATASTVAETDSLSVAAFAPTQAQLTPTELGLAMQVTDKELRRAFMPLMEQFSRDLGYGIAKAVDKQVVATVTAGAGNSVTANAVVSSDITTTDTIDHLDVLAAMEANAVDNLDDHMALVVRPEQHKDLSADATFLTADKFGSDLAANRRGFVGQIFGIPVYQTTQITVASNKGKALLISSPDSFSYIFKTPRGGVVRTDYDVLGRFHTIGATVDFDDVVTRANAICTIESYI
jgi:N4-gp56 family major capsid protein